MNHTRKRPPDDGPFGIGVVLWVIVFWVVIASALVRRIYN